MRLGPRWGCRVGFDRANGHGYAAAWWAGTAFFSRNRFAPGEMHRDGWFMPRLVFTTPLSRAGQAGGVTSPLVGAVAANRGMT